MLHYLLKRGHVSCPLCDGILHNITPQFIAAHNLTIHEKSQHMLDYIYQATDKIHGNGNILIFFSGI